jgi:hypothetical protein
MHIIFGEKSVKNFENKYVVLELDTLLFQPNEQEIKTYCLVENIPINNLVRVDEMKKLHSDLIVNYRMRDWNFCEQAMEHLVGFWGNEVDSFYIELQSRIKDLKKQNLNESWDWRIVRKLDPA